MLNVQLKELFSLKKLLIINCSLLILTSCSIQQKISKSAKQVINDSSLLTAHVGISIYEPASGKYWYNYQGDKYFVPASNTKIPTCYAAMKFLGDSLVGLRYRHNNSPFGNYTIIPTGDPTFLHSDFKKQNVLEFFEKNKAEGFSFDQNNWFESPLGSGWTWNDYDQGYMAERSPFPIYGNVVKFKRAGNFSYKYKDGDSSNIITTGIDIVPQFFKDKISIYNQIPSKNTLAFTREINENLLYIIPSKNVFNSTEVPFITNGVFTALKILDDTLNIKIATSGTPNPLFEDEGLLSLIDKKDYLTIHSQPTDSLLKPMMHRSDNFFAEQSLLMVSNERLGVMNDEKIIDTLLKTDFKDLPQKPRWADGSGLSRYNLFTPQNFVAILNKMKNEFGIERIKVILPTGGEGTISNYYKADSNYIFAKTGTLSGVVALSGFLYTKKGKLLIFSTLVNNHQASSTAVRRAVEKFIEGIRNKY
jgi:D-alanyl-D-alanine carboxypeptidase/D-alanyl-D-alanine-endopeptidase (penicillin-binding protein 4)